MDHKPACARQYPLPYCGECGYPLELGVTAAGRRAWFCAHPVCRWFDTALVAVYIGRTNNLASFRVQLWESRMRQAIDAYWPVKRAG